jgi:collagen type IV alpha-3-binding protein
MEREVDGIVVDPLKALHSVKGVSAREYIDLFFDPTIKMEWDDTTERVETVQTLTPHTVILHQVHRRVWPAAARESLFWSQRHNVTNLVRSSHPEVHSAWLVCNHDTDFVDVQLANSRNVRVKLTIAMLCQTVLEVEETESESVGWLNYKLVLG